MTSWLESGIWSSYPQSVPSSPLKKITLLYAVVVFGYLTATLATFFIDRDAESDDAELASAKSIKALQVENTGLRTDIQALVQQELDSAKRTPREQ